MNLEKSTPIQKEKKSKIIKNILLIISVILSLILLTFLYRMTPFELKEGKFKTDKNLICLNNSADGSITKDFLVNQLTQADNEINQKSSSGISWFYYRFLIIGFMIGGVIVYVIPKQFESEDKDPNNNKPYTVDRFIRNQILHITIGITCIISICIDNQIRQDVNIINQRGLWLAEFPEKLITNSLDQSYHLNNADCYSWESFLRIEGGLQKDKWVSYSFWLSHHPMTIILYIIFLYYFVLITEKNKTKYAFKILWIIHICFLIFAFQSVIIPDNFVYSTLCRKISPIHVALIKSAIAVLFSVNILFIYLVRNKQIQPEQ